MWRSLWRLWLPLLAFCFSAIWAWRIPTNDPDFANFFPDEGNHMVIARYLAENQTLPPYSYAYYEVAHPPLYHALAALVLIAAKSIHADMLVLRLVGALMGALLTFLVGEGVVRVASPRVAALAAGLAGLLPSRVEVTAGVSNENLAALAGAGALAALALLLRKPGSRRGLFSLALWTMLAVGSKITGLMLLLGVLVVLVRLRMSRGRLLVVLAVVAAGNLPWMAYNTWHYGDPYLLRQTEALWSQLIPGLDGWLARGGRTPGYVRNVVFRGWELFVGAFDGLGRLYLPTPVYVGALLLPLVALSRRLRLRRPSRRRLAVAGGIVTGGALLIFMLYNLRHFSPQARFLFVALFPLSWWCAEGWLAAWPPRWRDLGAMLPLLVLIGLNLYAVTFFARL